MAQTFEEAFATGLSFGFTNRQYTFKVYENSTEIDSVVVDATSATNGVFTIGSGELTIPEDTTIDELRVYNSAGSVLFWTDDSLNGGSGFSYPIEGTFTASLEVTLSGNDFQNEGLDSILNSGLQEHSGIITGNFPPTSFTWGSTSSTTDGLKIDIASTISIPISSTITSFTVTDTEGTNYDLFEVTGLNVTGDTLVIESLEVSLTV